jgi:hypothetical protein
VAGGEQSRKRGRVSEREIERGSEERSWKEIEIGRYV